MAPTGILADRRFRGATAKIRSLSKMATVMSKMVAMMAVRNGGDALGYGDDDGNDAMAVRLMTAMMAMTLWKRTVRDVPIPARVQVCDRQWRHRQTQQTCNTWLVIYRTYI